MISNRVYLPQETVQNAEDAGASEISFILDERRFASGSVFNFTKAAGDGDVEGLARMQVRQYLSHSSECVDNNVVVVAGPGSVCLQQRSVHQGGLGGNYQSQAWQWQEEESREGGEVWPGVQLSVSRHW